MDMDGETDVDNDANIDIVGETEEDVTYWW